MYPDDQRSRSEFSWLTDIEKIQLEIAKDLEQAQAEASISPEQSEQPDVFEDVVHDPWLGGYVAPTTPVSTPVAHAAPVTPISPTSGFYRETIKGVPQRRRSWAKTVAVILLVCTLGTGSLGFGLSSAYFWARQQSSGITYVETVDNPYRPTITSNQYVFEPGEAWQSGTVADMVQLLEPAVVGITTRFDTANLPPVAGSGTIFAENDDRIFIVTGHYVAPGVGQMAVRIAGSQPLLARHVQSDVNAGLSVISIYKQQLLDAGIDSVVIATFGDSSQMQVGDTVFAIGNARNEGNSVTRGIISAGKQELIFPHYTLTVLQTDAAINYGNSGGPLININGEVIGINIDRAGAQFGTAQIEGIGYSIASNVVIPIVEDIIDPNRPGLGIMGQTLDEERAAYLGIPAMGVVVAGLVPGGAAEAGGLRINDIITAFAGEPVFMMSELQQAIRRRQIGDIVEVRILREGSTPMTLEVELRAFIQ